MRRGRAARRSGALRGAVRGGAAVRSAPPCGAPLRRTACGAVRCARGAGRSARRAGRSAPLRARPLIGGGSSDLSHERQLQLQLLGGRAPLGRRGSATRRSCCAAEQGEAQQEGEEEHGELQPPH